jgi:hypothetical protein
MQYYLKTINLITLVTVRELMNNQTLLPYKSNNMKIEYNNLYIHFILITKDRSPIIPEKIVTESKNT